MDPLKYGKLFYYDKTKNTYLVHINDKSIASITVKDGVNSVEIIREGKPIITYIDTIFNTNIILRTIGKNMYYYNQEGGLELVKVEKANRFIKTVKPSLSLSNKFLTLDLETRLINNKHVPYLGCTYDGKVGNSFYLSDFKNVNDMLTNCILSLCRFKYNKYKIYVHNLANFDGIFLLKILARLGKVKILLNEGRIISIDLKYKKPEWKDPIEISFRDSYQLLPASLQKLARYFQIKINKGIFPYKFINNAINISLQYEGYIPNFKYFDNITRDEYNEYCAEINKGKWILKDQAIKYCLNDCIVLYNILINFNELYFNKFKININEHPTLASHAMRSFKTHNLEADTVPMIYGEDHDIIRLSYTGGSTDMFIPINSENELVYGYDVNALYPTVMKNYPMPVAKKFYFQGDITKFEPNAFGFFQCEIEAPKNLKHPILQLHMKTKNGVRTLSPTGSFTGLIFSEEMYNAMKYGYKFKILWGYTFEKKNIFKEYVDSLYQLRLEYPKDHPMNYIAKLLLNSLYGRFGMKYIFDIIKIVSPEEFLSLTEIEQVANLEIKNVINLDKNFLIQYINEFDPSLEHKKDYNVNIAIASAITAYARIYMSKFKNNPKMKLFYTDTDSAYTNLNPDQMNALYPGIIDNKKLGKLKLETISSKAIFIAPKVYYLKTKNGEEIYKVKGLDKNVFLTEQDFEQLLTKGSLENKTQTKWYKSLSEGSIELLEQTYNKRELIYNYRYIN